MKFIVYHGGYGCETGCCGHWVEMYEDGDDPEVDPSRREKFDFGHADDDQRAYAEALIRQEFGAEHVADLDWENSVVLGYDC